VEASLKDTVAVCQEFRPGPGAPPPSWLLAYPDRREWYSQITADYWLLVPQMGATLAQRLDNLLLFLAPGAEDETLIVGLRTPQLSTRDLHHAFIALGQRGACVGPTGAGGVYALGIRGRWPTGVLQQVRWHERSAGTRGPPWPICGDCSGGCTWAWACSTSARRSVKRRKCSA